MRNNREVLKAYLGGE
ncbi:MAG: hypothetical protein JRJ26_06750 [Deltaproteobacteria bacterium]|nr:hypothetical protein [Deltaproteobacteria bacterium]